jgi:hypothetical protein
VPDEEVFKQIAGPRSNTLAELTPYYQAARQILAAGPHPRATDLLKVEALERRAREIGNDAFGLNISVNFDIHGQNPHGVQQR